MVADGFDVVELMSLMWWWGWVIEGVDVSCGHGSGDGMGRGFVGVEVGYGKVVHGELGHGLTTEVSGF